MPEDQKTYFEASQKLLENYIRNRMLLLKMQAAEKSAQLVSLLFTGLIIALLSFFVLLFLSIVAGYFFAKITGSFLLGFGLVALVYILLLAMVIYLRKKWLGRFVSDQVVKILFETGAEEEAFSDNE